MEVISPWLTPMEVPNLHSSPGEAGTAVGQSLSCAAGNHLQVSPLPLLPSTKGYNRGTAPVSQGAVSPSLVCVGLIAITCVGAPLPAVCQGGSWWAGGVGCVPRAAHPGSGMACLGSRSWWHLLCLCAHGIAQGTLVHAPLCGDTYLPRLGREWASSSHSCFPCFSELLCFKLLGGFLQEKIQNFLYFSVL